MRQIGRDRRTLLILLFVPAFFLLVYGYALNFDIRNIRARRPGQRSQHARAATSSRRSSTPATSTLYGDVAERRGDIDGVIDRNEARAVLVIPARFGRDVAAGRADQRAAHRQRRQREHRDDGDRLRHRPRQRLVGPLRAAGAAGIAAGAAADRRAARLVQPRAAQHAVPGAGAHRLHRDADGRRLHGALDRAREGGRHDGAGADVADRTGAVRPRQDGALLSASRWSRRWASSVAGDGAVRPADARLVAGAARRRSRCSWSARWPSAC